MKGKYGVFLKYAFGSGFFAGLDVVLLYVFKEFWGLETIIASAFSFTIALTLGFIYQKYITFADKKSSFLVTFIKFTSYQIGSYILYATILWIGTEKLGVYYVIVAGFGKCFTFLFNFIMNRYFNFSFKQGK